MRLTRKTLGTMLGIVGAFAWSAAACAYFAFEGKEKSRILVAHEVSDSAEREVYEIDLWLQLKNSYFIKTVKKNQVTQVGNRKLIGDLVTEKFYDNPNGDGEDLFNESDPSYRRLK